MAASPPPPPPPKKLSMSFGKKTPPPPPARSNEDFTVVARRLRLLEERYERVERNLHSIENHIHTLSRDFSRSVAKIKSDIESNNHQIEQMQERMLMFLKELDLLAKSEDLEVIRKYLKYWDPVKFVQVNHVEKIVRDTLAEMGIYERH